MRRLPAYRPIDALPLVASAVVLSFGLVFAARVPTHPMTAVLILSSLALALVGGFGLLPFRTSAALPRLDRLLIGGVIVQLPLLVLLPSIGRDSLSPLTVPYAIGAAAALPLAGSYLRWRGGSLRDFRLWTLIAIHLALGVWTIGAYRDPVFDVHMLQSLATGFLLDGQNPYAMRTYPDLYGPGAPFYGPGLVEDGYLTVGFPYPPLSLLLALPGEILAGDYRYSQLVSTSLAAALIAGTRPSQTSTAVALLLLFTPRTFFLLAFGWTEPFAVVLLALVVFVATLRRSTALALTVGLLAAVKQTMLPVLVLGPVLLQPLRPSLAARSAVVTLGVVVVLTLPFAALDLSAFLESTVEFHVRQAFRADGVTAWAWFLPDVGARVGSWPSFTVLAVASGAAMLRMPRTPAGFSAAVATSFFAFFLLSEYAYFNYYYFILGALCCSLSALQPSTEGARPIDPTDGAAIGPAVESTNVGARMGRSG